MRDNLMKRSWSLPGGDDGLGMGSHAGGLAAGKEL